jgi:hypothetical protein
MRALSTAILTLASVLAQSQTADPKSVPVIDGGIGPCTADFTITDSAGAPIYAASIKVHIAYRFLNAHKLDLEVGTNATGEARFTGLPEKTKQPLLFRASAGSGESTVYLDPAKTCKAELTLKLDKKPK